MNRVRSITTATAVAMGLGFMSLPVFSQSTDTTTQIDVPAQPLAQAIQAVARQASINILVDPRLVEGRDAPAIKQQMSVQQALDLLLQGTGLTPRYVDDKTITLVTVAPIATKTSDIREVQPTAAANLRLAQENDNSQKTDNTPSETSSEVSEGKAKIQQIVVTAQKREERLQDVPISISVVTAEDIQNRGLVSSEDYLRGIPGVNQASDQYGQSIVIRGIETFPAFQNYFGSPTVATYFGETPTTSSGALSGGTSADAKLFDIERVEVLRGPQGTSFGSSSLGGVVRTIPVAPKLDRFAGKLAAGYSDTSRTGRGSYNVQGMVNLPVIIDRLALRATAYHYEESGIYRNVSASSSFVQQIAATYGAERYIANKSGIGDYLTTGGRIAALYQAAENLKFTVSYLRQESETDGFAATNVGSYDQLLLQAAPEHSDGGRKFGLFDNDLSIANTTMEYGLGWADVVASYSYLKTDSTYVYPLSIYASGFALPLSLRSPSEHQGAIGEVRLVTDLPGQWNFVGGAYYENLKDEATFDPNWYGSADSNIWTLGETGSIGWLSTERQLAQKAAFAEASWELLPRFTLTAGARLYKYDRSELSSSTGDFYGELSPQRLSADESGTSIRANLSYKPTDESLIYAGWSQGFRLGRAQTGLNAAGCDLNNDGVVDGTNIELASTKLVNSDSIDNYEVGAKFSMLDRRLMVAADIYRMDWTEVPVTRNLAAEGFQMPATCYPAYTANAGVARSEGIEIQANLYFTKAFRLDLGGSWIKAELTKDVPAINAFQGNRLPASPEYNANLGLQYAFNIGTYEALVRVDSIYIGEFYGNLQETQNSKAGGYIRTDLSAGIRFQALDVDLFVKNVTNEDEFSFRTPEGLFGYRLRPRTIGVRLTYDF